MAFTSITNGVNFATLPTTSVTPTTSTQLANKSYIDTNFQAVFADPGITYSGTFIESTPFTLLYTGEIFSNGTVVSGIRVTTNSQALFPNITALDLGTTFSFNMNGTWAALTSLTANSAVVSAGALPNAPLLTSLSFPNLIYIGGGLTGTFPNLTTLSLPNVSNIGGNNVSMTCASLTTFSLPALLTITNASFTPTLASCTTVSLPLLSYVGDSFAPVIASCTTLTLTALAAVRTSFAGTYTALTTMSLPAIVSIGTTFTLNSTAPNLVTFSMGSTLKSVGGNFVLSGASLDQASVDGILVSLAALDGTNGTTAYSSLTVTLTGGTNATPSATGLAAKSTLEARSCTVTNN